MSPLIRNDDSRRATRAGERGYESEDIEDWDGL